MANEILSSLSTSSPGGYDYNFSTLAAWEADSGACPADLVTGNYKSILEVYDDWPTGLGIGTNTFSGHTCAKATDNILLLRANSGDEYGHTNNTGSWLKTALVYGFYIPLSDSTVLHIEDLKISSTSSHLLYIRVDDALQAVRCGFYVPESALRPISSNELMRFNFCLFDSTNAISGTPGISALVRYSYLNNCVLIADNSQGAFSQSNNNINTIAFNKNGSQSNILFHSPFGTSSNNASSDNSAPGTNSEINIPSSVFKNYSSDDYHLASDSTVLNGAGLNLIDNGPLLDDPQLDIDGEEWPGASGGAWDIGFDYYVDAGGETPVSVEIPKKNITLTSYAPAINISDHVEIAIPKADIQLTSHIPTITISSALAIIIPKADLQITSYAPEVSTSDHIEIIVPKKNLTLSSYSPIVTIGDHIEIVVPKSSIRLTSYAPEINISDHIQTVIPKHDLSLISYAPVINTSDHIETTIPKSDIQLQSYAPVITVGDEQVVNIPKHDLQITSYAPTIEIGNNISVIIPQHNLELLSYPPSIVISAFADVEIPKTNINITSYAPSVVIAGAFETAPERMFDYPAVNRMFRYPAINRMYRIKRK